MKIINIKNKSKEFAEAAMKKLFLLAIIVSVLIFFLTGCGTVPITLKVHGQEIFYGSATGIIGGDAKLKLKNIDGVSCEGSMKLPIKEMITDGKISCTNGSIGKFIAMRSYPGNGRFWSR